MFEFELPEKFRRHVPLAVWLIAGLVLLLIPLKIIGYGYLPGDDALRHCAKAVSGKPWPEILVLGDAFKLDHNLGWHALLGFVHRATGWGAEGLVILCVGGLFLLVNGAALAQLKRPEAWLVALLAAMIVSDLPQRFLLGRPFSISIAVLMTILLVTQNSRPSPKHFIWFTALLAVCTFFHGVWYLWLLPVAAFFFAGQFQWSLLLAGAWLVGTAVSALLTGHPVEYLSQALDMALGAVDQHATSTTEVTELQPFGGDFLAVIILGALAGLRLLVQLDTPAWARSPAFWLMCGCWLLGFRVGRFWEDWGWPALMVLIAVEVQGLLESRFPADSLRRLLLAAILGLATFLAVTSDLNGRYTKCLTQQFLSTAEHPDLEGWMPEKGGVLYSADMGVFYQTFYKNPKADWRYMVGYEPALMPAEDFKVYQKIHWNFGNVMAYEPWINKMKKADRLVISSGPNNAPNIPPLEWHYGVGSLWIGRTPRTNDAPFQLRSLRR